ncbi:MAG: hypothetical protein IT445_06340 [Phycisphaeraceae bacterium]|nr:hypothetical protein [Phycisphaeraceae bacterium]
MSPRIVEITPEVKPTFWQILESHARAAIPRSEDRLWGLDLSSGLEREIGLTLAELDRTRTLHENLRRGLLRQECYLDTELMRLDRPRYPPQPYQEHRRRLKDRLSDIERERRRLALIEDEQLRTLHEHLMSLLNKHRYLAPREDGR